MLSEDHKEIASGKKTDDEGYMARVELDNINNSVSRLKKVIKKSKQQLPAWVQSKITRAADYIDTAADYLSSEEDLDEDISFSINKDKHKKARPKLGAEKIRKMSDSQIAQLPPKAKEIAGVRLPNLTERILAEMGCDCDMKPAMSVDGIAKKHNTTVDRIEKQLKNGIKVEMEHTTDKKEAEQIALQHLAERPDYYTRLKKVEESTTSGDEGLRDWFNKSKSSDGKKGWVQIGGPYAGESCARQKGQKSTPKCGSSKIAEKLSDKEEDKAFKRKNRQDPNQPEKTGTSKPTYVKTKLNEVKDKPGKGSGEKDACYHKVKSRFKVWPSAYGSGALVKCRKVGADNWGNKNEEFILEENDPCWTGYQQKGMKKKKGKMVPNCVPVNEGVRIQSQSGQVLNIMLNWRSKIIITQIFFPQITVPKKLEVYSAVEKVYPGAKVISFRISNIDPKMPLIQVNEEEAWQKANRKDRVDGLSQKAVNAYRREHPGSRLQTAVTEKKPSGKRAKRRKSYCSRSDGQRKMHNIDCSSTPKKPICKARRRWRC